MSIRTQIQASEALGRITAVVDFRLQGNLSPTRPCLMASNPQQELAGLIRAYRAFGAIQEPLEERLATLFSQVQEIPEQMDTLAFFHGYYVELAALKQEKSQ